jgi:hypothetical protein
VHAIPAFSPQYLIINRDQETWTYHSLEEAVLTLGRAAREQGFFLTKALADRFSQETRVDLSGVRYTERVGHLIVRTSLGDVVSREQVLNLFYRLQARPAPAEGAYRSGPWPGIRRRRGHRGTSIRVVRTKQATTWHDVGREELEDLGVPPSRVRRQRSLPTYWSDIPRQNERSWKSQRSTQWR